MKAVISRMLSIGAPISVEDDDVEFSFAMEYDGPPISYKLPRATPIDNKWIPTAAVVAPASLSDRVSLPVVQPLLSSDPLKKKLSEDLTRGFEADVSPGSCNGSLRNRGESTTLGEEEASRKRYEPWWTGGDEDGVIATMIIMVIAIQIGETRVK
ncbi:hypothetical protein NE237_010097 [Protea cynaroides]|uniref:Uncharacterized protein n=1 Tax=Protea cynaroides TaxID=273540 RepID=A0A9Q0R198_9MAGN|nr:hypothetical protein NE237_010097 [Protea cynaroides]